MNEENEDDGAVTYITYDPGDPSSMAKKSSYSTASYDGEEVLVLTFDVYERNGNENKCSGRNALFDFMIMMPCHCCLTK